MQNDLVRKLASECTLFLKRDESFPIKKPCSVALFGNGARHMIKGGTGSGEVYSEKVINFEEGLLSTGFSITTSTWLSKYDEVRENAIKEFKDDLKKKNGILSVFSTFGMFMNEPEYDLPIDYPGDIAIYILSRTSGEGTDRKYEKGDILLTDGEVRDILALNKKFKNFILVLNVGGVVDISPVNSVKNILLFSQLGPMSGLILSDIILGKANPSGKLSTTWASYGDYQDIGEFGNIDDTKYLEGIYVGYRYFDTLDKKPLYPFGYGKSYTEFAISKSKASIDGSVVKVTTNVTNTGKFTGKEVVQLYLSSPTGKLDKPFQALVSFKKSKELKPKESEELSLSFDMKDVSSYDTETVSYILEKGNYILRLGNSSRDTEILAIIHLDETVVTKKVKNVMGDCGLKDYVPKKTPHLSKEKYPVLELSHKSFKMVEASYDLVYDIEEYVTRLTNEELCHVAVGHYGKGIGSIIGENSHSVPGAAGDFNRTLMNKGFPTLVTSDGPAGLRLAREYYINKNGEKIALTNDLLDSLSDALPGIIKWILYPKKPKEGTKVYKQLTTMIPIGTAVAQSFNLELAETFTDIIASEMEEYGVTYWLAPALNIHRDIRCGRNFEYLSEDPYLSGKIAASLTKGIQKHKGCYVTIKHFAANNQETNRYGNNSLVSERAMREIYLRGFEIALNESHPGAVMTSYNLLNGEHTASHFGLINDYLRCECGFDGVVMTDWIVRKFIKNSKYPQTIANKVIKAGGDIIMPGSKEDYKDLVFALKKGIISRKELEIAASRIYKVAKYK